MDVLWSNLADHLNYVMEILIQFFVVAICLLFDSLRVFVRNTNNLISIIVAISQGASTQILNDYPSKLHFQATVALRVESNLFLKSVFMSHIEIDKQIYNLCKHTIRMTLRNKLKTFVQLPLPKKKGFAKFVLICNTFQVIMMNRFNSFSVNSYGMLLKTFFKNQLSALSLWHMQTEKGKALILVYKISCKKQSMPLLITKYTPLP